MPTIKVYADYPILSEQTFFCSPSLHRESLNHASAPVYLWSLLLSSGFHLAQIKVCPIPLDPCFPQTPVHSCLHLPIWDLFCSQHKSPNGIVVFVQEILFKHGIHCFSKHQPIVDISFFRRALPTSHVPCTRVLSSLLLHSLQLTQGVDHAYPTHVKGEQCVINSWAAFMVHKKMVEHTAQLWNDTSQVMCYSQPCYWDSGPWNGQGQQEQKPKERDTWKREKE